MSKATIRPEHVRESLFPLIVNTIAIAITCLAMLALQAPMPAIVLAACFTASASSLAGIAYCLFQIGVFNDGNAERTAAFKTMTATMFGILIAASLLFYAICVTC